MSSPSIFKIPAILTSAGLLTAAVILFLFYATTQPSSRSNTFTFTAWLSAGQVLVLLFALLYAAIKDGRPSSVVPVNSATVIVAIFYNAAAVVTILLFTQVLLPKYANARTYYAVCVAELGIALAVSILLQLAAATHQVGHAFAISARLRVDDLIERVGAVSSTARAGGWQLELGRCAEQIRFSEALRRNPSLIPEVEKFLAELQSLTQMPPKDETQSQANRLLVGIAALTERRM